MAVPRNVSENALIFRRRLRVYPSSVYRRTEDYAGDRNCIPYISIEFHDISLKLPNTPAICR
jgi:hypothetical protein